MSNPQPQTPNPASDDTQRAFLQSDREDLLTILTLRFGATPEPVRALIAACDSLATLERWILVAANVPDWNAFLNDLDAGPHAFKLVGANYEPNAAASGSMAPPRGAPGPREPRLPDGAQPKEE
jgi:hypothetical protein